MTEIHDTLLTIARAELDWEGSLPSGTLVEAFDSLQLITLVVAVEDEFHIEFTPQDEERLSTVDELVALIEAKRDA